MRELREWIAPVLLPLAVGLLLLWLYGCGKQRALEHHPDDYPLTEESDEELTDPSEPTCPASCYTRSECDALGG